MANILITGGSGLVGHAISQILLMNGDEVRWLSRESGTSGNITKYKWDIKSQYIDEMAFQNLDAIIHLAGTGIVEKRWTNSYKKEILDSRVKSSELLFTYLKKLKPPVKVLVGGSAIGYYGSQNSNRVFSETDAPGTDFLADVCVAWEKSYDSYIQAGIRTSIIRTGIVLSNKGGAYTKLKSIFNFGLGAGIANGEQAFPWIHINDLAEIFVKALIDTHMNGPYNAVATESTTNQHFSSALAKSLHRPFILPNIPPFLLNLVLGERAMTLTRGVHVNNSKLKSAKYSFQFENLDMALQNLVKTN